MNVMPLLPGSPEWLAHRAHHYNASDAPAMMGCSPYKSRTQLLHERKTGIAPEVDAGTQRRFDDGHHFEALARPLAEEEIGDELYPVTGTRGKLSASLDGRTMCGKVIWEHKTLNDAIRAAGSAENLPLYLRVQMEHQLHVSEAEKCLFHASRWAADVLLEEVRFWYKPDLELRQQIIDGWAQFELDLETYQPVEVLPPAVAAPVMDLPALSVRVAGALTVNSNLTNFGDQLQAFIGQINKEPNDDQGFADAEAAIKVMERAETALAAAESSALAQVADVDQLCRTVAMYKEQARQTRLMLEKMVESRKKQIKLEIQQGGSAKAQAHIASLNERLGKPLMPVIPSDFAGAMKNKRTIASLRDAVDTELARFKIAANEVADKIQRNLSVLAEQKEYAFLFMDEAQIVHKAHDDLAALVKLRIAEHKQAEEARLEEVRQKAVADERARAEKAEQDSVATETKRQLDAQAAQVAQQRKGGFTPLKEHVQTGQSNSTHFRVVTDDQIFDAVAEAFGMTRPEVIERLSKIDFAAYLEVA